MDVIESLRKVLGLGSITNADSGNARLVDLSLGSRGITSYANLVASELVQVQTGHGRIYGFSFFVSAAGGDARWNLIDATASGVGGTAKFTFVPAAVGYYPIELVRPLVFTSGIQINYTATAGNFSRQIFYGPA